MKNVTEKVSPCPLCRSGGTGVILNENSKDYLLCGECGLVFVPERYHLDPEAEKARYLTHRNSPGDEGYRNFLSRLTGPLAGKLSAGAEGLDYGAGPGPTVSVILGEMGFKAGNFDPFFHPDYEALSRTYDFVACTETAEHFRRPGKEFERLDSLLRPGGLLGVMTQMPLSLDTLSGWWYLKDDTHVSIYRRETMLWIARKFRWQAEFYEGGVVLFKKGEKNPTPRGGKKRGL